jgi:histidine triad (HIT) family protein
VANANDCVFCKVIAGDLPSRQFQSDDRVVAFADINPVAPVHILVVPREHVEWIHGMGPEAEGLLGQLVRIAGQVASEVGLTEHGYRLVVNQGDDAGQLVDHLHLHVLGGREMGPIA